MSWGIQARRALEYLIEWQLITAWTIVPSCLVTGARDIYELNCVTGIWKLFRDIIRFIHAKPILTP